MSSKIFSEASISTLICFLKTFVKKNKSVAKIAVFFFLLTTVLSLQFISKPILDGGNYSLEVLGCDNAATLSVGSWILMSVSLVSLAVGVLRGKEGGEGLTSSVSDSVSLC